MRYSLALLASVAFALPAIVTGAAVSAQEAEQAALPDGMGEAIMLGCLPFLTGMVDSSDESALSKAMTESGFAKLEGSDPLLSMLAPPGTTATTYGRDLAEGKVAIALADGMPFCTIAFTELDDAQSYFDGASGHFESEDTPFSFSAEEQIPGAPMRKRIYKWSINEKQSIGANVMRATVDLPAGRQFLLLTMFVSTDE